LTKPRVVSSGGGGGRGAYCGVSLIFPTKNKLELAPEEPWLGGAILLLFKKEGLLRVRWAAAGGKGRRLLLGERVKGGIYFFSPKSRKNKNGVLLKDRCVGAAIVTPEKRKSIGYERPTSDAPSKIHPFHRGRKGETRLSFANLSTNEQRANLQAKKRAAAPSSPPPEGKREM